MSLPNRVFLIGIGGTAMGNLAVCLKRAGVQVGGSDGALYPPISTLLDENGIGAVAPADVEAMEKWSGSLYIVGNAVSRGHPQVEWLMSRPFEDRVSFPQFMGEYLLRNSKNLVVAGTHGKSTTTALAAHLLSKTEEAAGWFIGGVMADHSPAFSWNPEIRYFAIEGDEYDSAFFDKRSKFVHYRPNVLIVNNLEFDHADIFRDAKDVQRSFRQAISIVPSDGVILYNGDDLLISEILPVPWTQCVSFGFGDHNDFIVSRKLINGRSEVDISRGDDGSPVLKLKTHLMGGFNARNLAAAALGTRFLLDQDANQKFELDGFTGLKRRQEVRFQDEQRILIEDFAHHPTAIKEALSALRERFPEWSIHAMVEPRSNTMRTNCLQDELIEALALADYVTIAPVHRQDLTPVRERLNTKRVSDALGERSVGCSICVTVDDLHGAFRQRKNEEKELTVVFSNGAFCGLIDPFEAELRSPKKPA